jgi:hypothetical protein
MIWLRKNIDPRFILNVIILLFIQVFIANRILIMGRFEWYFDDIYSFNLLQNRQVQIFAILIIMLLVANYIPFKHNHWLHQSSWSALEHGKGLRILVMIAVFIITWAFTSYGYNYYFNQSHYWDRLLLIGLAILVYINPIFAIPFTMVTYVASYQFMYLAPYSYTDKQLLFEFLALFGFFSIARPFTRGYTVDFVFVALCMIGAYYYFPGIEKLHIGADSSLSWAFDNKLHHYVVFSYQKNWLSFRSQELVYAIADFVDFLRVPFQLFTLFVEVGVLFILVLRRRGAMIILLSLIMLHTGIMLSAGVFFWKWISLDAGMIWFLWKFGNDDEIATIFKPVPVILSVIIIASGTLFFDVIHLGWWNSPIHTYYKFDVIDTQGDRYDLAYSQLQPYDFAITQNRLHFVNDNLSITGVNGGISAELYEQSLTLTLEDVPDFIQTHGTNRYNSVKAEGLKELLRVYAYNFNQNYQSFFVPSLIQPPLHINSQPRDDAYNFKYPITEVRIRAIVSFYDGDEVHIVTDDLIHTMPITVSE